MANFMTEPWFKEFNDAAVLADDWPRPLTPHNYTPVDERVLGDEWRDYLRVSLIIPSIQDTVPQASLQVSSHGTLAMGQWQGGNPDGVLTLPLGTFRAWASTRVTTCLNQVPVSPGVSVKGDVGGMTDFIARNADLLSASPRLVPDWPSFTDNL